MHSWWGLILLAICVAPLFYLLPRGEIQEPVVYDAQPGEAVKTILGILLVVFGGLWLLGLIFRLIKSAE